MSVISDGDDTDGLCYRCPATTTTTTNSLQCISIARHIASCQTYEGGFGAEIYNEAHGGYAFCAIASLHILNKMYMINTNTLLYWLCQRQLSYEGGFAGRTNKLVDGCYSFWQGGAIVIMDEYVRRCEQDEEEDEESNESIIIQTTECNTTADKQKDIDYNELDEDVNEDINEGPTFDEYMLQRYILLCAQDVNGGLRDKPSKSRDFYHSCYTLSGLSVSQPTATRPVQKPQEQQQPPSSLEGGTRVDNNGKEEVMEGDDGTTRRQQSLNRKNFGDVKFNIVGKTDPVINIRVEHVQFMLSQQYSM